MSSTIGVSQFNPQSYGKDAPPSWDENAMRIRTRRLFMPLIGVSIGIWVFLLIWVLYIAPITVSYVATLPPGVELIIVLAPALAATLGVERLLEAIFNSVEGSWHTLVAYLGYGMQWLKSAETEVAEARQWLRSAYAIYNGTLATNNQSMTNALAQYKQDIVTLLNAAAYEAADSRHKSILLDMARQVEKVPAEMAFRISSEFVIPTDLSMPVGWHQHIDDLRASMIRTIETLRNEAEATALLAQNLLDEAQARLRNAENKLEDVTSSPNYRSAKSIAAVVIGLMIGTILAAVGQIKVFALLGIAVPARLDVLVTGLLIGSGAYPMHSLVGILHEGRNALHNLSDYLDQSGAMKRMDVDIKQRDVEARQIDATARWEEARNTRIALTTTTTAPASVTAEVNIGGDFVARDKTNT